MARSEARLQFGCWRKGLADRGPMAKLVYAVLLTEPTINQAGVGAIRIPRWAKEASLTIPETEAALAELGEGDLPQVILDHVSDEVFIRTLIRNDRVADQPYVLKGALREAEKVESEAIRRSLAAELRKLPPKQPDAVSAKTGKTIVYPDPHATADVIDPGPSDGPGERKPTEDALFDRPATKGSERVSSDSQRKGSETHHGGGGGGGGGSTPVGSTSKTTTARKPRAKAQHPDTPDGRARTMADWYVERSPLSSFMGVLKRIKDAQRAEYSDAAISAALKRLLDKKYAVTANTLLYELEGPDGIQVVPSARTATGRAQDAADAAWDEFEARHGSGNVHPINARSQGA